MNFSVYKAKLEEAGVRFAEGLTETEVRSVEETFAFSFPPDLKAFLMFSLPTGEKWPNWRDVESPEIKRMVNWPYEGICFDIQHNDFWPTVWGAKPTSIANAFKVAKQMIGQAPALIPIYGHRYLPAQPPIEGNPVFSVYQTDIIYYGSDLWNYFQNEFHEYFGTVAYQISNPIRHIEFWSDIIDGDLY